MVELDWLESANKMEATQIIKELGGESFLPNKHDLFHRINKLNNVRVKGLS